MALQAPLTKFPQESDVHLVRLAGTIRELRQRLNAINKKAPAIGCFDVDQRIVPALNSDDDEALANEERANEIDVLSGQLYEIAWQVCDVRARTLEALKLKAQVLEERCNEDHCDVIAALARSLSQDIMLMPKWSI